MPNLPISSPMTRGSSKSASKSSSKSLFADDYSLSASHSPSSNELSSSPNLPSVADSNSNSAAMTQSAVPPTTLSFSNSAHRETNKKPSQLTLAPIVTSTDPLISPSTGVAGTTLPNHGRRSEDYYFGSQSPRTAATSASSSRELNGEEPSLLLRKRISFEMGHRTEMIQKSDMSQKSAASQRSLDRLPTRSWAAPIDTGRSSKSQHHRDKGSSSQKVKGYNTYEGCMQGALGHDTKSATYKVGTEKAYHHLRRANDLFLSALQHRPNDKKALLGRSRSLIQLATDYQPPLVSTESLREAVALLRHLTTLAPHSLTARESLAEACSLLSSTLHEIEDYIQDESRVWNGEIGDLAREALQHIEDVAADRMDRMRQMDSRSAAEASTDMVNLFLSLSDAALKVSNLAPDLYTVEFHIELAEQALDQASNMSTVAATSRVRSSHNVANLIARVQQASGKSSLERLRHTFFLGVELDEEDFRALLFDISLLANECRERAAQLKGEKGALAATMAWEAVKQFADANVTYSNLLRLVWRNRHPRRRSALNGVKLAAQMGNGPSSPRRSSVMGGKEGLDKTIHEEGGEEEKYESDKITILGPRRDSAARGLPSGPRRGSQSSAGSDGYDTARKGSNALTAVSEDAEVSSFPTRHRFRSSISIPATGRRSSWLPSPNEITQHRMQRKSSLASPLSQSFTGLNVNEGGGDEYLAVLQRNRRVSSAGGSISLPDGISAWNRRASVISIVSDEGSTDVVPSSELAKSSWLLLETSIQQYKIALNVLADSNLPNAQLAKAKNETLCAIAYASMFQASLAPRLTLAAEKREALLVKAEVYATWGAREVGWSFLIEGTKEAQLADRRTNSWRADEAGKHAVMLLLRIWWHRAVTTPTSDVDTKRSAKDAVETVVRRMKEKEGAKEGDVYKVKWWLSQNEGELDVAEVLFWKSVCRIFKGGKGFVMS